MDLDGPNNVIGRSMVLYEREDDFDRTEHPATKEREGRFRRGHGDPIACCVIGWARPVIEEEPQPTETKPEATATKTAEASTARRGDASAARRSEAPAARRGDASGESKQRSSRRNDDYGYQPYYGF